MDDLSQGGEEEAKHVAHKPKGPFAEREEKVLEFWNQNNIFKKSLEKPSPKGDYVFYDGPPFATGLPHFGHLLQSALKDAIPRYRTMRGYRVARQWGWDCHGLPLENQIEQELGFRSKRDIEEYGIGTFNEAARGTVLRYADDWRRIVPRIGRWVDMDHDYKTMDTDYTESVWWAFKNLYDRKLIYEGFKAMHFCPRCSTTLSNFEVAQGYQDIPDIAVTVKLPLVDEPETSLLIWTTTPWTLPGNTAAAVNAQATYVKVRTDEGFVVLAKDLIHKVMGEGAQVFGEILGKDLVGKRYEPPFPYFKDLVHKHKTHAWKVYAAPYVTLQDGTGIVHLAPAYGAEDLELSQKEKIPLVQHVTDEGKFVSTVSDFAGLPVKPKGRHMETDAKIVELLEKNGRLFAQEKITHSYPHCWRCDTPLLNWAATSWFVNVSAVKKGLLGQNKKVSWVPEHVGRGRFQNGLASAPDWAISRSRYWGAPIPVWKNTKTKELKVVGSIDDLLPLVRTSGNTYFVMRHGQSRGNVEGFVDSNNGLENHLTDVGKAETVKSIEALQKKVHIDMVVASPTVRAQETAAIARDVLGLPAQGLMTDERIRETGMGTFNGKPLNDWRAFFGSFAERFKKAPEGGETYTEVRRRVGDFLFDLERRYTGKNILIVTHGSPSFLLNSVATRQTLAQAQARKDDDGFLKNSEIKEIPFVQFPHNLDYEVDLHRPYIDEVPVGDTLSGEWKRVPDVFDCWFESGSMPFASHHYPFEKRAFNPKRALGLFPKGYPAHFIAESIDQTRGWFYSLIVLGVALFGKSPYKVVVTNGLVLAEDGRKMSKKLKNYPDPMELVDTFGADALRYYLLSSAVIRGEDLRFSQRGVEEVSKKLLMRLDNVRSFYDLYASGAPRRADSTHALDRWILSRLSELVQGTTEGFEKYELDVATRPLAAFIDDLSTWYLRRSRDRFKTDSPDKADALATLRYVLFVLSHAMAPVMPFYAEDLYLRMKEEKDPESVHLCAWPAQGLVDKELIADMAQVRAVCSRALELRESSGMKIRQPLALLTAKVLPQEKELHAIIADEVNVKRVLEDRALSTDVVLDTTLTPELREEGMVRDFIRAIQDIRKTEKLTIADRPTLVVFTDGDGKRFFEKHTAVFVSETNLADLRTEGAKEGSATSAPFSTTFELQQ